MDIQNVVVLIEENIQNIVQDTTVKKTLGFRWSKKAKIPLETIFFWQSISISTFKFSPFLYTKKTC